MYAEGQASRTASFVFAPEARRLWALAIVLLCCCSKVALSLDDKLLADWRPHSALLHVEKQVGFGSRALGEPGHERAIRYISAELRVAGIQVSHQSWMFRRTDGKEFRLTNIIGRYRPSAASGRVLLGTHYDSIIKAYRDRSRPTSPVPGANNSASGVAALLETVSFVAKHPEQFHQGIDFVFFDGEEGQYSLGEGDPAWFALGSPKFVDEIETFYGNERPSSVIILDMVCYRDAVFVPEASSLVSDPKQVHSIWSIGKKLAPSKFDGSQRLPTIHDDQTAFQLGGIPSVLIIGFKYEPWYNTTLDTPDKCSESTIGAVGTTLVRHLMMR